MIVGTILWQDDKPMVQVPRALHVPTRTAYGHSPFAHTVQINLFVEITLKTKMHNSSIQYGF